MKTKHDFAGIIVSAALAVAALGGCAGRRADCRLHSAHPASSFDCFGYHSTCWRPWPEECPTCPSFAILPPPLETVIKDIPFNQHEPLPPLHEPLPPALQPPPAKEPLPAPDERTIEPQGGAALHRAQIRDAVRSSAIGVPLDNR